MSEDFRRSWNKRQGQLRHLIQNPTSFDDARSLFLRQHADLHTKKLHPAGTWCYEDEIFSELSSVQTRTISKKEGHSIAWLIWHIARIEDVTMNILVADQNQIFNHGDWQKKLDVSFISTGNRMTEAEIAALSTEIDIPALRAYRLEVGKSTQEIVNRLTVDQFRERVQAVRLNRIRQEGAVVESAGDLLVYWGRRDVAGLLLMPATRHNFVHLNEASRIKIKLQRA